MKNTKNFTSGSIFASEKEYLSEQDQKRFRSNILTLAGAIVCLVAALVYEQLFPDQEVVRAFIYLIGIGIIGTPIIVEAIQGIFAKDMKYGTEILVSITIIVAIISTEFFLAIIIPIILACVHFLEEKSILGGKDAIDGLKRMQSETAFVVVDEKEIEVDAKELKINDVIIVRPGMALPVDGEVIFGVSSIDQQSLTGESVPKTVTINDYVFAGTINIDGIIQVKVTKPYTDTSFQKIVNLLADSERITIPETQIVDTFMYYYIPLTLITAFLVWLFTQDITRAIAILIASCPSGHLLISSAPMIASLASATKRGVLIKNAAFLEKLSETDCMIFDKTGTITNGILDASSFHLDKAADLDELTITAAMVAHASLHPISKSIIALCANKDFKKDYEINEVIGNGLVGRKGKDVIYCGNYRWIKSLGFDVSNKFEDAGTCSWVIKNDQVMGCILFKDIPRDHAAKVITDLKDLGVTKTCLLSGDSFLAAQRIQIEVGIDEMHCDLLPEQKLMYVEQMMEQAVVTVIGDGINDALALAKAHVGIAMGAMGSDTAIQSADIALMNNNLDNIPFAIKLARRTKNIIYQNIILSFSLSAIMIFIAGSGIISPVAMAIFHNIGAFAVLLNSGRVLVSSNE